MGGRGGVGMDGRAGGWEGRAEDREEGPVRGPEGGAGKRTGRKVFSDRSSARGACPQVLQRHPGVAKGASGRSSSRQPCPQVLQSHPRVAKGRKSVPLTGLRSGLRPGLARRPYQQVPQWHPRVAKRDFWPVFGPSGGQHIRRTRGYAASGPQVCIFSAREYVSPVRPPAYSVGPGIFSECPAFQSRS